MRRALATAALFALTACAGQRHEAGPPKARTDARGEAGGEARPARGQEGLASFYGEAHHGRRTANGERFDMLAMTCAHRTLPFGTRVRVTDLETGRAVVVRVNDRGPFAAGRVVDLSLGAARKLGIVERGLARVRVERADDRAAAR